jgi:hypothetical protein
MNSITTLLLLPSAVIFVLVALVGIVSFFQKRKPTIKCNIQSDGDKVYHMVGDRFYEVTKVDETKGEFYAKTIEEAEGKGFRRSKVR